MYDPSRARFDRLPATERLVLIGLRARLDGNPGPGAVETLFRMACGLVGVERALARFDAMVRVIVLSGRRRFIAGGLGADRLSPDEHCVLALLAAHQHGDPLLVREWGLWLVKREALGTLTRSAEDFARTLSRSGRTLSRAWIAPADSAPAPLAGVPVPALPSIVLPPPSCAPR